MGWQSSLLGGNVVSSYLHIDNLRNDLTSGKFWDSGETKYVRAAHDGTNGVVDTSSGALYLKPADGSTRLYGSQSHYVAVSHDGTNGALGTDSGALLMYPATGAVSVYSPDQAKEIALSHNGTNGVLNSNNGKLILEGGGDNRRVQIGSGSLSGMHLRMKDAFTGGWVRLYVYNGTWSIESDD